MGRKISTFVLLMAVTFTVTILPFGAFSIARVFSNHGINDRCWRVACILAYLNSALNPLCYAFGNKNFNDALKNMLRRCRYQDRQSCSSQRQWHRRTIRAGVADPGREDFKGIL